MQLRQDVWSTIDCYCADIFAIGIVAVLVSVCEVLTRTAAYTCMHNPELRS